MLTTDPTDAELVAALRTAFRTAAAGLGPDLALTPGQSRRRRDRRPRPLPLGALALGLAVVLTALVVLWPGAGQRTIKTGGAPIPAPGVTGPALPLPEADTWQLLPTATASSRQGVSAVWTGSEMLVMGGSGSQASYASGISFDPAHSSWGSIPASPLGAIDRGLAVWTGTEMIVLAGRASGPTPAPGVATGGAAYNPSTRAWRTIAPFPWGLPVAAVWTGSRLLVWDWYGGADDSLISRVASYDPATNSWFEGPAQPGTALRGDAVWDGSQLIVVGTPIENVASSGGAVQQTLVQPLQAMAYDPRANIWNALPAPPLPGYRSSWTDVWTGTELFLGGGTDQAGALLSDATAYSPATNTWRSLPSSPIGFAEAPPGPDGPGIWTGSTVLVLNEGNSSGQPLLFDPSTDAWAVGATEPLRQIEGAAVLWTGSELFLWGGASSYGSDPVNHPGSCCTQNGAGWVYIPPVS